MHHIVNVLQKRAQKNPHQEAVLYLEDGEQETARCSYFELDQQARAIAVWLQTNKLTEQRILLLYPAGIDFVASLIGCWYAGAIAVPVPCPKVDEFGKQQALINRIAQDADVAAVMTTSLYQVPLAALLTKGIPVLATETLEQANAANYQVPVLRKDAIAYLQYTSGSTSAPKAAIVSHENLQHSLKETINAWSYTPTSITLNWAPHTHVYGLVCGILIPLYHGTRAIIMPPAAFINKPIVWLAALSSYQVSHSGCPNFGYDLCVRHINETELLGLNLSQWQVAVNGGDVVQQQTLTAFVHKFQRCGFALKQMCSAYGMSELAGAIAATPFATEPRVFLPQGATLSQDFLHRPVLSSGKLLGGLQAIAVDPQTGRAVAAGEVGEIWLSGKSVVSGYWRRPQETAAVFNARVPGSKRRYFKTGDLGFIADHELYLTGRLKEVMIVYGKKYYPLDFELSIASALTAFPHNLPQAVFSSEIAGKEEIIVVQELSAETSQRQWPAISNAIRHVITQQYGVDIHQLVFVPEGAIPKTGSGKLQRKKCQLAFNEQTLPILTLAIPTASPTGLSAEDPHQAHFKILVANVLGIDVQRIDLQAPLSRYQFDSINIIQLIARFNEAYQLALSPAALYEYATLAEFYSALLVKQSNSAAITKYPQQQDKQNDIAIIGISGMFPQAPDLDDFWDNLVQGKDCISEVPAARWDWRDLTVQWGGFIEHVDAFDAAFFNISPREAELIDPQQRLFLQTVWKTIEDAGYTPSTLAALKTGLFVGVFNHDYAELLQQHAVMDAYVTTGTMNSMIANRISYFLNLRGPSEAIDTACSSSLVAVHQAVHAILHGDCDLAIAGGVNTLISPTSFISAHKAGMLSADGRCKTFDKDANGYVRGEGAGALLLKKLTQALQDGDHIYGVIKGTAINHGGHVNSLTAPNPNAQAEVIVTACQRAQVAVDSIQYIETHGTGTPLGDPIEINGLKKAFQQLASEQQLGSLPSKYCGLGAVKTQIGHLESAAGVAGIIKILLAMRHELIPGNLHLNELNPYLDIEDSPFYLLDKAHPWPQRTDAIPRRAGVSSFGFGGANAHVIIEESPKQQPTPMLNEHAAYLITLSARTPQALQQRLHDLLAWLERQQDLPDLAALSYTLNAGREHFEQRFAVVVDTVLALRQQVQARLSGAVVDAKLWVEPFTDLYRLRAEYLEGKLPDWRTLYGAYQEKITLPAYPFAKEPHWFERKVKPCTQLHALIDENISTLSATVFSKLFTGAEFYLREHQVNNQAVLPGVVCLEMARIAASMALKNQTISSLSNLVWEKPINATALAHALHIKLVAEPDFISFVITDNEEAIDYVRGRLHTLATPYPLKQSSVNLQQIRQHLPNSQTPAEIYRYFKNAGLDYGANFQVIQSLYYDESSLLAELALPASMHAGQPEWLLHPGLCDGILQTTQALLKNRQVPYLPFSMEQMHIYAPLPDSCVVHACLTSDVNEQHFPVFDLQVTDAQGTLLVLITGFTLSALTYAAATPVVGYYQPQWTEQPRLMTNSGFGSMRIIGHSEAMVQALLAQFSDRHPLGQLIKLQELERIQIDSLTDYVLIALEANNDEDLPAAGQMQHKLQQSYYLVHQVIAALIHLKPTRPSQIIVVCKGKSIFTRALAGLVKTLGQEQPNLSCRLVELYDLNLMPLELSQTETQVRYDVHNRRFTTHYELVPAAPAAADFSFKTAGAYLITGGLGGLGYLLATYLAEHYQARLLLTGRSSLGEQQLKMLATLEQKGAETCYVPANIDDYAEVEQLITRGKQHFGAINGIIHAAGLTADGLWAKKTSAEMATVLAPKVQGTVYLHAATGNEPLAFFVLFSSVAAVFGNPGQSDYAYANAFLDEFALAREQQRLLGHCAGRTIAINWPHWEEGGLKLAPEYQRWLEKKLGIVSLSTAQGLTAFVHAVQYAQANCIVLPGYQAQLVRALHPQPAIDAAALDLASATSSSLRAQTEVFLTNLIATTLKQSPEHMDANLAFEHYGIDSLMIIQLNERLEREFPALPKTLFFEYQNLATLTDYFIQTHGAELEQLFATVARSNPVKPLLQAPKRLALTVSTAEHAASVTDIAIIGVHGRYPQAQDLGEFWDNLLAGKDCIGEIPQERWDLWDYYDSNKDAAGKTYSKWGGFLSDIDKFDPLFFNISPREAALMDPQERLFLETAWKTIEDAGYAREQLAGGKIGVYVGVMYGEYQLFAQEPRDGRQFTPTHSVFASIANRVSYFFDFHGPSIALDTMCSSSLTAIHLACKSIRDGECQLALAGGVNLSLHPNKYLLLSHGKFLASDGHCRSFGHGGDGYVPGEGVGAVLLKPLHQALADGDHIYAVVKGSQLNHGGKTNGYTVPNPNAQAELIAETYRQANLSPAMVSYIEAHGTGTSLGDPIEMAGLNKAFYQEGAPSACAIGSVKSNIGHCESAAGIAALTKVILQLQHRTLVPSLWSATLNSNINWDKTAFRVQQNVSEWAHPGPRIAGVSSFGAGGANAHLILAEAPKAHSFAMASKAHYLLTLSAKTELALRQRAQDLLVWLRSNPDAELAAVAYTLNKGRSHFDWRCALVISSLDEAILVLAQIDAPQPPDNLFIHDATSGTAAQLAMASVSWERDNLQLLAKSYVAGNSLDWDSLYAGESWLKISLPTYPFAKERHWYAEQDTPGAVQDKPPALAQAALVDKVCAFLLQQVGQLLKISPQQIALAKNLGEYGMDSVHFVALGKRIAEYYQIEFTPAVFYTYSSISAINQYLISQFPAATAKAHELAVVQLNPVNPLKQASIISEASDGIAIIGMHGLFPQSADLATFWQHLVAGDDLVTEVPAERWNWRDYYGEGADKSNSKWGGFIQGVEQFDAAFFNISAREANFMDPQQRLFLETAWKTIEDAGYNPFDLSAKKVGVFAGVEFSEYQTLISTQQQEFHGFIATGNSHSMIANRVSYFFNFHGPSEAIDTACSSSLVAIHRAVQAIRYGECELAIAGGVSLMLNPDTVVVTSQLGALSADGRCKTFAKEANGYVKGEGVGSLLLKPLKQAQADGDHIYAIIRGSAVNHGGRAQSLTAPNASAQSELLISAYTQANIDPNTVSYIETHGTGTALGDPVEIEGLKLAFAQLRRPGAGASQIALGSVKTNIGHLEPASGIAGVMKLILSMSHELIPRILHLDEVNPYINLSETPFYIAKENQPWQRLKTDAGHAIPLRAGVSSFGFGGTNAHVVLEEGRPYPRQHEGNPLKPYYLVLLSAKQQDSLQQKISELRQWLVQQEALSLAALSYTLSVGRAHFVHRCALVVNSLDELVQALSLLSNDEVPEYCMLNQGQSCVMQGPVFDEVYQSAMKALQQPADGAQYRHKLFILADLYTKHYPIDWQSLYGDGDKLRVAGLPAYPFSKQRYWYDADTKPAPIMAPVSASMPLSSSLDLSNRVLAYLRGIFAEKLQASAEAIQLDETYEVYGVDSLIGLEITTRLEKDFGVLPKTLLYERNRLKELAPYFIKNHQEKLPTILAGISASPVVAAMNIAEVAPIRAVRKNQPENAGDIAIIGLSGTFPMANTMDEFWDNLSTGRDCVGEVPAERWDYKEYPVQVAGTEKYFPHGGFIPDVDKFDPLFFNISPRDAGFMDPQERLFMQSVWSTLEDAGYTREKLKRQTNNSVGVFAGVTYNFYPLFIAEEWQKGNRVPLDIQSFSVANRISYFLDLNGPSLVVDTACSSSLAAIHLAYESILRGDCAMAIAGGVNLSLHPSKYHFLGSFSFMSEQGRCTSFAEGGTGYVPSEGVGSVLLKPLAQAIADNDLIYGVIKGSSMNHGGKTSGYTVPNPNAQAAVIRQALEAANIDARSISYIEAHGTGTALGDPIEVRGLQEAFETFTQDKQFCAIGSVKSNIGHLESAAGISQLAKVVLQMRHKQLAPTLHTQQLNSFIDFNDSPFYVQRELAEWKADAVRRAGISSFGAGGANVHMIIEEYQPKTGRQETLNGPYLFLLSAQNEERLAAQAQQMHAYLADHALSTNPAWLRDVCYTLQIGRESMGARLAISAKTKDELLLALANYTEAARPNVWLNYQVQYKVQPDFTQASGDELVQYWVNGAKVDWQQCYPPQSLPNIISLPTYPFAKRRCWIPTKEVMPLPEALPISLPPAVLSQALKPQEWLYRTQWEQNPLQKQSAATLDGKWLIFSDTELGLLLQQELGAENCIYCFSGDEFARINEQTYYLNPARKGDYETLFQALNREQGGELKGVLYLGSALNGTSEQPPEPSLCLLYLFKAMSQCNWSQQLTFCLISQGAQQVRAQERINLWQHHLWSMTRIFAAEQASYQALLLDLDTQESLINNAHLIVNELRHAQAGQNHVAYRGTERYTIRFITEAFTDAPAHAWTAPVAALITGGLGALGYEVAQFIAAQGTRFILLTGSTELSVQTPEKNNWLTQLAATGVQVRYVAVDVADAERMSQVVKETETSWQQAIDGVFHLAGVTTDNVPITAMEEDLWQQVLKVKIDGALVLHELFKQQQLACFVLFSSIAAVPHFGMAGLSAYAVANEFLSGLALYRRSLQLPALSINWVAWSEKGMSHRHNHDAFLDAVGMASLSINEGISLLHTLLQLNPAEITVCKIHWKKFLQINATAKQLDFFSHYLAEHAPVLSTVTCALSANEIAELIVSLLAASLALERYEIEAETPFQQYGMDSIMGINFTAELGLHFPDVVAPMDLYRYPTLKQLSEYLIQRVSPAAEPTPTPIFTAMDAIDIEQLSYDELNKLLESELKELELAYD